MAGENYTNNLVSAKALRVKIELFFRKKILNFHAEGFCEEHHFLVRDATDLCFDLCNGVFSNVPSGAIAPGREHGLGQVSLVADFSNRWPSNERHSTKPNGYS